MTPAELQQIRERVKQEAVFIYHLPEFQAEHDRRVLLDEVERLQRELERLRAVEAAARYFLDHYAMTPGSHAWNRSEDLRDALDAATLTGDKP